MNKNKHIINITGGGLFVLTIVSSLLLSSPLASADNSAVNNVRITIPSSCNLSSSNTTAHTATIDAGTYRADIGESTITATCNDAGGFAIYAIGYGNDIHGNNTLTHTTNPDFSIVSGTATSGATSNWAMKLTAVEGTYTPTIENGFGSYSTVPETNTKVASHASVTDQTNGASFKSTYAAYIAPTQTAGTYEGKVKYTLVHPNVSGDETEPTAVIIYNPNATDVRGTMNLQYASGETVLDAPNYARSGYGFAAWNTQADGNGTNLGPNETIDLADYASLIDEDNNTITLYAKWVPAEVGVTMQTFDDAEEPYASYGENTVIALEDERDHDVYAVAKLADGNWWMIENLRIDGSVDAQTMASLSQGVGGDFTKLPNSSISFRNNTFNETYPEVLGLTTATLPQINTSNTVLDTQTEESRYLYGNYYSFAAAIADTTSFNGGESLATSICPKGWRLPTLENGFTDLHHAMGGENNGDFTPEGSERWRTYPMNFIYSGSLMRSLANTGSYGYYRIGTVAGAQAYITLVRADALSTVTSTGKTTGMSIRCIAN